MFDYDIKMIKIYYRCIAEKFRLFRFDTWQVINNRLLKTYRPDQPFARCMECGRDVHDFSVPDDLWLKVSKSSDILCYDCFCDKLEKINISWRMKLT